MSKYEKPLDSINFTEGKIVIINMGSHPEKTQEIIRALCLLTDQEKLKMTQATDVRIMVTRARELIGERLNPSTDPDDKKQRHFKSTFEHLEEFLGLWERQNKEFESITGAPMEKLPDKMLMGLALLSDGAFRQTLTDITRIDCSIGRILLSDELVF